MDLLQSIPILEYFPLVFGFLSALGPLGIKLCHDSAFHFNGMGHLLRSCGSYSRHPDERGRSFTEFRVNRTEIYTARHTAGSHACGNSWKRSSASLVMWLFSLLLVPSPFFWDDHNFHSDASDGLFCHFSRFVSSSATAF
jgi:hypothetical protein